MIFQAETQAKNFPIELPPSIDNDSCASDDHRRRLATRPQRFNIKLLFVDEGHVEEGTNLDLWALPDDLTEAEFPRGSCEVVVVGLLPKGTLFVHLNQSTGWSIWPRNTVC